MIRTFVIGALGAAAATGAQAVTVLYVENQFGAPAGYTLYADFDDAGSQALVTGNDFVFAVGDVGGRSIAAPGNATPYLAVLGGGVANIGFVAPVRSFSFDYSTVDSYNVLTINYADGGFDVVRGADILGSRYNPGETSGSFIINGDGRLISGLSLSGPANSFEVDNLATSAALAVVPEPATWAMMIVGFGLVGYMLRRRAAAAEAAA